MPAHNWLQGDKLETKLGIGSFEGFRLGTLWFHFGQLEVLVGFNPRDVDMMLDKGIFRQHVLPPKSNEH